MSPAAAKRSVGAAHAAWASVPGKAALTTAYPAASIGASTSPSQAKRPRAATDLLQDAERNLALLERAVRDGDGRLGMAIAAQLEPVIRDAYGADLDADARNRLIELDLRARSLEGRAALLAEDSPSAGPLSAGPARTAAEAREHLESAVARAEHLANGLSGSPADVASRIPPAAQQLTAALDRVDVEISQMVHENPKLPAQLGAAFERLDRAMSTLFSLGRGYDLPLRGSGLEQLFDAYDQLRSDADQPERDSLANRYYFRVLEPAKEERAPPGAAQLARTLAGGTPAPAANTPRTRDDLVNDVLGFSMDLGRALDRGRAGAAAIITEPPPVEHPGAVELLAELAAGLVLSGAGAIIGEIIDAGFDALEGVAEENVESAVASILKDTFKDLGKDAVHAAPKLAAAGQSANAGRTPPAPPGIEANEKLTARTKFLEATRERTDAAITDTDRRFTAQQTMLMRVPVEALESLRRSFDDALLGRIEHAFQQSVIREWVNFTQQLGQDQDGAGAQLANMGDPAGVLQIRVKIAGQVVDVSDMRKNKIVGLAFEEARLGGVSPAVVDDLRRQPFTLGSLPIGRRVTCSMSDSVRDIIFDVGRTGDVALPPMPSDAACLLALVGGGHVGDAGATEAQRLQGARSVIEYLTTIPAGRIEE